ncbi:hypothetical protein Enr13x_54450 [Stieleria neptunia]|uniref:Uncharacterized protein n=1 Tax=Stieleria neptunia TaxID=2527979 RepID=A0A518HXH8_9BACT|nr:hypothetical protein Enr13x_54450 [Stieleria neptunia]
MQMPCHFNDGRYGPVRCSATDSATDGEWHVGALDEETRRQGDKEMGRWGDGEMTCGAPFCLPLSPTAPDRYVVGDSAPG